MALDAEARKRLYRQMLLCRRFEEKAAQSYGMEKIHGFCHLYIGQEAVAVGSIAALRPDDYVVATYREHAHALVKGSDPGAVMAELYGRVGGVSKGMGGSMHLFDVTHRMMGGHAIVGGHAPLALGLAFAEKYKGSSALAVCYLGEAASNQGAFLESLNMAVLWKLPVIFIIENNLYGMGTAVERSTAGSLVDRGQAFGMPSFLVDGMDVEAMYQATLEAAARARSENLPSLLEARCYRFRGHSMSDPATYRSKEELAREQARDPLERLKKQLLESGEAEDAWFKVQDREVRAEVQRAAEVADASPEPDPSLLAGLTLA